MYVLKDLLAIKGGRARATSPLGGLAPGSQRANEDIPPTSEARQWSGVNFPTCRRAVEEGKLGLHLSALGNRRIVTDNSPDRTDWAGSKVLQSERDVGFRVAGRGENTSHFDNTFIPFTSTGFLADEIPNQFEEKSPKTPSLTSLTYFLNLLLIRTNDDPEGQLKNKPDEGRAHQPQITASNRCLRRV